MNKFLGIGPVTNNLLETILNDIKPDSAIEVGLVISRRQIDAKEFGGGYLNNSNTEDFSKKVKYKNSEIKLCRDHGGPFQGASTRDDTSKQDAIEEARKSFRTDIRCNFDYIHIDNSKISNEISVLLDQYEDILRENIKIEIGTEEQVESMDSIDEIKRFLSSIKKIFQDREIKLPEMVVIQTGSKVLGNKNTGEMVRQIRNGESKKIKKYLTEISKIAQDNGMKIKLHNMDYLTKSELELVYSSGIGGVNIAPEFATNESKQLIEWAKMVNDEKFLTTFYNLTLEDGRYKKWIDYKSRETDIRILGGHYIYNKPTFQTILSKLREDLEYIGIDIERELKLIHKNELEKIMDAIR